MKSRDKNNWDVKWTNMGVPGKSNYVALFTCRHIRTNILYSYDQLQQMLEKQTASIIPQPVITNALYDFLKQQISNPRGAN